MNNLNIFGNIPKQYQKPIEFFIRNLFSYQIIPYVYFQFSFRKKNLDVLGDVLVENYWGHRKPREFLIRINKEQEYNEMLLTLAHELCHCKQYASGDLYFFCDVWKKQRIDRYEYNHFDLPWEKEAEEIAEKLVEKYNVLA